MFYSGAGRLPWILPPLQWPSMPGCLSAQDPSSQETDTVWPRLSHMCQAEVRERQNKDTWNGERVFPQGGDDEQKKKKR